MNGTPAHVFAHVPILALPACPPGSCPAILSACLQINSETDFVARNEQFHGLVGSAAAAALGVTSLRPGSSSELEGEALKGAKLADGSRCVLGRVVYTQMAEAAAGCGPRLRVCLASSHCLLAAHTRAHLPWFSAQAGGRGCGGGRFCA